MLLLQVLRTRPVEREIREGRLRAPARGDVQVVDEFLNALQNLLIGEVVLADIGRKVGVEGRKGLSAGPLVLHRAEEVDDLSGS